MQESTEFLNQHLLATINAAWAIATLLNFLVILGQRRKRRAIEEWWQDTREQGQASLAVERAEAEGKLLAARREYQGYRYAVQDLATADAAKAITSFREAAANAKPAPFNGHVPSFVP